MEDTRQQRYPTFDLIDLDHIHLEHPAIVELFEELAEQPDRVFETYRADIYSDRPFATQPEFTVEIVHFPDESRCAVEWVDGVEWIECDDLDDAVRRWINHHVDH